MSKVVDSLSLSINILFEYGIFHFRVSSQNSDSTNPTTNRSALTWSSNFNENTDKSSTAAITKNNIILCSQNKNTNCVNSFVPRNLQSLPKSTEVQQDEGIDASHILSVVDID